MTMNVRDPEIENLMRRLGRRIKSMMPIGWGFTLLIFSFGKSGLPGEGEHGATFYISSAERESMIEAMKEFIKRHEN